MIVAGGGVMGGMGRSPIISLLPNVVPFLATTTTTTSAAAAAAAAAAPPFHKSKSKSKGLTTSSTNISSTNYNWVRVRVCCCRRPNSSSDSRGGGDVEEEDWVTSSDDCPYRILGLDPTTTSSPSLLKAAFRSRVKKFHPDVCKDLSSADADAIIQRVILAYQTLSKRYHHEEYQGASSDPFEEPECEAYDLFINELLCIGKGCQYSCVQRAPYAFSFTAQNGTARATSQGQGDDYQVQLAVGQCPKRCIHYVTPSQRAVLEDLLDSVLTNPYNVGDAALLESLIAKATSENNRYQKPKREPKISTEYVDWC